MIKLTNKNKCSGCSACESICPKKCISLKRDYEGFAYINIDKSECVNCGLCEKVCPFLNSKASNIEKCYAMWNSNEEIRFKSSSGGAFSYFAEKILHKGGVVFGAKFNENWELYHDYTETIEGLEEFRGSKYVQSNMSGVMPKIKEFLDSGRQVLFCGTPCQVTGLKLFLRKEYENLLTIDFICHGVPSPKVWAKYLEEFRNRLPQNHIISNISFRDKTNGWENYQFKITLNDQQSANSDKVSYYTESPSSNLYMKAFLSDLALRPSCYKCKMRKKRTLSDLTICDFWYCYKSHPEMNDNKGVSGIIVRNKKVFDLIDSSFVEVNYEEILIPNQSLEYSPIYHYRRNRFFKRIDMMNIYDNINRNYKSSTIQNIVRFSHRVIRYFKKKIK